MAHPFAKIFETALRNSTTMDNRLLEEAETLKDKGYGVEEIYEVLLKFRQGRIDDEEAEIANEALEEFGRYRD